LVRSRLVSVPRGIAYLDARTGASVMVAGLRSCGAEVLSPTAVIYRDAFDAGPGGALRADLVYEIGLGFFEQSLVLRSELPAPEWFTGSDRLPFDRRSTRVLLLTEVFGAPAPEKVRRVLKGPADAPGRASWAVPELIEGELLFGPMRMIQGRAFVMGDEASNILTAKSFDRLDGRDFIVEGSEFLDLSGLFQKSALGSVAPGNADPTGRVAAAERLTTPVSRTSGAGNRAALSTVPGLSPRVPNF
jgi:hypothetical protein